MNKSKRMRWAGHVARMGRRGMHIEYWWESQKERDHWEDQDVVGIILERILREIGWSGMDWIDMAQGRDQCRALVKTVMNLRVPENIGKFLSSCTTGGFSRRSELYEGTEFLLAAEFQEFGTQLAHSPTNDPSGTGLTQKRQSIRHNCLQSDNRL
jgi:hypothetical protein